MKSERALRESVIQALRTVGFAGENVYDLEMIKHLHVEEGRVSLTFSPSSVLCASIQVAFDVRRAVRQVKGVGRVELRVEGGQALQCPLMQE